MTGHTPSARPEAGSPAVQRSLLALLIAVTVCAAAWLGAVYAAPVSFRVPLAWGAGVAGVLLCAAVTVAVHALTRLHQQQAHTEALRQGCRRLADETVPALVERLRQGSSAETALASVEQPEEEAHRRVITALAEEVGKARAGRAAALSAAANAAGRMQALATSMLADLRQMEHRHTDEDVLADLLHLDHRTAQAGRLADSIAVLAGARSGRRWSKPIVMESVLRGAMGRIAGYQRVRIHSTCTLAVAGHAAEGVMHALAELLDNAANFSPPTAEVHVYVEEVPAGVVISVEDSGLVMSGVALRRAERAVSGEQDLTSLSGTRLGLAVVGRLARKYGLQVSFRPSARGGTGVLLLIPQVLLSRPKTDPGADTGGRSATTGRPAASAAPDRSGRSRQPRVPRPRTEADTATDAPAGEPPAASPAPRATAEHSPASKPDAAADDTPSPAAADGVEYGPSGLPKRRRGQTLARAEAQVRARRTRQPGPARHSPAESAARFGAFRRAVRGERDDAGTPATPATSTSHPEDDNR